MPTETSNHVCVLMETSLNLVEEHSPWNRSAERSTSDSTEQNVWERLVPSPVQPNTNSYSVLFHTREWHLSNYAGYCHRGSQIPHDNLAIIRILLYFCGNKLTPDLELFANLETTIYLWRRKRYRNQKTCVLSTLSSQNSRILLV